MVFLTLLLSACANGELPALSNADEQPAKTNQTAPLSNSSADETALQPDISNQSQPKFDSGPRVLVSPEIYQPTYHAILALEGGVGQSDSATSLHTKWRRDADDKTFELDLNPGEVKAIALEPGRYHLVSATDGAGIDYADKPGMHLSAIDLDPAQVRNAGKIIMTYRMAKGSKVKKVRITVINNTTAARSAIEKRFPQRGRRMKNKLVPVIR